MSKTLKIKIKVSVEKEEKLKLNMPFINISTKVFEYMFALDNSYPNYKEYYLEGIKGKSGIKGINLI